jgi:hypothetical protein
MRATKPRVIVRALALLIGLGAHPALACSLDEAAPSLIELIKAGKSVAIITPTQITAPAPAPKSDGPTIVQYQQSVRTAVRVVEPLIGPKPRLQEIEYLHTSCGGHRLEADRFYVLAIDPDVRQERLDLGSNALVGLGDEYREEAGVEHSNSKLLTAILEFRETGAFGLTPEELRPFRALTLPDIERPSRPLEGE